MLLLLLLIVLLFVVGGLPTWGYHQYGYGPSGAGGIILFCCSRVGSNSKRRCAQTRIHAT